MPVLLLARSPARASALARTTSGSRGSGGRTSCQRRSRRTLGRWIRVRCTVAHLLGRPPHPWGPMAGGPALSRTGSSGNSTNSRLPEASPKGAFRVGYGCAERPHPKVLRAGWGAVSGIRPSCRARAAVTWAGGDGAGPACRDNGYAVASAPRIAPQPNRAGGWGRGRLGPCLVRCGTGDRAGYASRAGDRLPAHSGRIGRRPWCGPGWGSIAG